jgi:hypothetical protein
MPAPLSCYAGICGEEKESEDGEDFAFILAVMNEWHIYTTSVEGGNNQRGVKKI